MRHARTGSASILLAWLSLTLSTGCDLIPSLPRLVAPSPADTQAPLLLGTWVSSTTVASPESCGNLQWQVTEIVGLTATGQFSASCAGGIELQGTGSGTLNGSILDWTATGTATAPGSVACDFTLAGSAVPEVERLRITYTGTTCLGPVSGTEQLTRR